MSKVSDQHQTVTHSLTPHSYTHQYALKLWSNHQTTSYKVTHYLFCHFVSVHICFLTSPPPPHVLLITGVKAQGGDIFAYYSTTMTCLHWLLILLIIYLVWLYSKRVISIIQGYFARGLYSMAGICFVVGWFSFFVNRWWLELAYRSQNSTQLSTNNRFVHHIDIKGWLCLFLSYCYRNSTHSCIIKHCKKLTYLLFLGKIRCLICLCVWFILSYCLS